MDTFRVTLGLAPDTCECFDTVTLTAETFDEARARGWLRTEEVTLGLVRYPVSVRTLERVRLEVKE